MHVSNEKTAQLTYHMDAAPIDDDALAVDIWKFIADNAPKPQNLTMILAGIAAKWVEKYDNKMMRLRAAIEVRLVKMLSSPTQTRPVRTQGGGKQGKVKFYWMTKKEADGEKEELTPPSTDDES
jgi:hypothetical protein